MIRRLALLAVAAAVGIIGCSSAKTAKTAAPATPTTAPSGTGSPAPSCATASTAQGGGGGTDVNTPGDIPDTQAFRDYSPPDGVYTVKVPEGWARSEGPGTVTFTDKFNSIRIELVDASQPPTVQSVKDVDLPRLAATERCFGGSKVTSVQRNAGTAVLVTYQADSAPEPVTGKVVREDVERHVFWKNAKSAVITLASPVGSDNVDPWKTVTDSFQWR